MTLQSTVNQTLAYGVQGELSNDGPIRASSRLINSNGASPNVIGYAFTMDATTGVASVGGVIAAGRVFAGILANPKEYSSIGTSFGTLAPTLALPDNSQGDFVDMGSLFATLNSAASIGDLVVYDTTTGALSSVAPGAGSAGAGKAFVPNCVVRTATSAAGPVAIRLTN